MRWRIPLVVALALFVAVSCDQQPVEPVAPEDASFAAQVFHFSGTFVDEFDTVIPCGGVDEPGHFVINGKWRCTQTFDAAGGTHMTCSLVTNGHGIGDFGSVWTIHEVQPFGAYTPAGAQEEKIYHEHFTSLWVGKGHAPSWNDWYRWNWVMNANGEVKIDDFSHRTSCPEG